jgi:hypothetical protein
MCLFNRTSGIVTGPIILETSGQQLKVMQHGKNQITG